MIEIKVLNKSNRNTYNEPLKDLECSVEYPYGQDFFRIDHGHTYFSFFDRMGLTYFNIALDENDLIASGCGILRSVPATKGFQKAWYLCDLKVIPGYRNQKIPKRLFRKNLLFNYLKCPRGYAISMNPAVGVNRVVDIIEKFPFAPLKVVTTLYFFEISRADAKVIETEISKIVGEPIRFLSLSGIKDIVLKSTGRPMPLYHAQHGPLADPNSTPIEHEGRYMFCAPESSKLFLFLSGHFKISATASVLAHRMNDQNWDFILSSDI